MFSNPKKKKPAGRKKPVGRKKPKSGTGRQKSSAHVQLVGELTQASAEEQIERFKAQALANMGLDASALSPDPGIGPRLLAVLMLGGSVWVGWKIASS